MKKLAFILLIVSTCFLQMQAVERPESVIILNGSEIITMEEIGKFTNYIARMYNGVTAERRAELVEQFGDKIPPRQFIMEVFLLPEKEIDIEEIRRRQAETEITVDADEPPQTAPPPTEFNPFLLNVNDTAADFTVQMINGETITLSDLRGQVVLLNFWATWCAPCIRKFYAFPSVIIEPFKNSPFVLLPVSIGETMETVKEKMTELEKDGINFNVGIDPKQYIFNQYVVRSGIPLAFLIDKNGVIRYISIGHSDEGLNNLASMIEKLVDEEFEQERTGKGVIVAVLALLLVFVAFFFFRKMRKKHQQK
jgi:peroxiredoxin